LGKIIRQNYLVIKHEQFLGQRERLLGLLPFNSLLLGLLMGMVLHPKGRPIDARTLIFIAYIHHVTHSGSRHRLDLLWDIAVLQDLAL